MKDRIRQIMEAQHMSQQVFANFIGTTPATLSGIFNDRTRPTINIIESIKKKFPDISLDWLMFGQGDMYQQPDAPSRLPSEGTVSGVQTSLFGDDFLSGHEASPAPTPQSSSPVSSLHNGVFPTRHDFAREDVKFVDKPVRRVTEIRVYYDDQTWESFVPAKK